MCSYEEVAAFVRNHNRSFTKTGFCPVFCKAWIKAAAAGNDPSEWAEIPSFE
jgi:hypothetical protein